MYEDKKEEYENDYVVLKSLNNSQNITLEFLKEIASNKSVDYYTCVVTCYGISQDPATKNYLMVMDYKENSDLRKYLKNNASGLNWQKKLVNLSTIAEGLNFIHRQGLIHRDFHSGNILNGGRH